MARKKKEEAAKEEEQSAETKDDAKELAGKEEVKEETPSDLPNEDVEESEMESGEAKKGKGKEHQESAELLEKVRLFNKWSFKDLSVSDESLINYINLRPIIIPHTSGKHSKKKFWKSEKISIVERFVDKMLAPGLLSKRIKGKGASLYMGKKQKALKILFNAFVIIEAKTGKNPIQALLDAIVNVAPREETTRISMGGISCASGRYLTAKKS